MNLNIDQLEVFIKSAESGSFTAAAKALHKTQPAISTAISNLEIDLGVELFDRTFHKPILTDYGKELLADAHAIITQAQAMQAKAHSLETEVEAVLTIALAEFVPHKPLISLLKEFENRFPYTTLNLFSVSLREVKRMMESGEADIGILLEDPYDIRSIYHSTYIFDLPAFVVVGEHHPLSKNSGKLSVSSLANYRQLYLGDAEYTIDSIGVVQQSSAMWRINNVETLLAALHEGLGWSYVPEHIVADALTKGSLTKVPVAPFAKDYTFKCEALWREGEKAGPAAKWVLQCLSKLWL